MSSTIFGKKKEVTLTTTSAFLEQNKAIRENQFFAATKSLCDGNGDPLLWEVRPLSTKEEEKLRDSCTREVPVPGKPHMYRPQLDTNAYLGKIIAAMVIVPDLLDKALQDSYGVKTPEELVREMIDEPGEYNAFLARLQKMNGSDVTLGGTIEQAKN